MDRIAHRNDLIKVYFENGYTAPEILTLLKAKNGINLSLRQLRRILSVFGLKRRNHSSLELVVKAIKTELSKSGELLGYRSMLHRLKTKYHLQTSSEVVMIALRVLDLEGVSLRRSHKLRRRVYISKGPNYIVSVDGYDKLKPFGFAIHGAICGFSRRILWLRVGRSNNDPHIVLGYFLDYLREINGVPRLVRIDGGTENILIEDIQKALRWFHTDGVAREKSVIRGKSTSNQRIERWWGTLRQMEAQHWINLFKDMDDTGLFNKSIELHCEALRYVFMRLLQKQLDQVKSEWNSHRIQRSSRAECPPGKPDVLFFAPQEFGASSYTFPIPPGAIQTFNDKYVTRENESGTTPIWQERFDRYLNENDASLPECPNDGIKLYAKIIAKLT